MTSGARIITVLMAVLPSAPAIAKVKAEYGIASWYGATLQGHATASGEPMDRRRLTAAHRYLPFGTVLEVTNRRNGRHVIVTVNDRGPGREDRVIDLSPAAARVLGMRRQGLAPVRIVPAPFE